VILKSSAVFLCLVLSATSVLADNKKPKPKQEAKDYYEQATKQNDPVEKAHLACQAAQLEPKEKRYSEECARDQAALSSADAGNLQAAKEAFQARQYDKAEASARAVTSSNEKAHSQAAELIGQIQNAKNLAMVQSSWVKGDFDAVKAYYFKITDPSAQATAKKTLDLVELYNNDIAKARVATVDSPQQAIEQYQMAYQTNPHGPVDVQSKIAELKIAVQNKRKQPEPTVVAHQETPPPPVPATPGNVAALLSSAKDAEKAGNLQEALSDFQAVLAAQANNGAAKAGVARIQPQLQAAADHKAIHDALRAFYDFKFDDAQSQLEAYLKTSPLNPGVANFYLGATLLEQSMIKTPQAQWQGAPADAQAAFKEAHKANYTPNAKYVSPAILKVWDSSGQ
jgi:hypothetical protein